MIEIFFWIALAALIIIAFVLMTEPARVRLGIILVGVCLLLLGLAEFHNPLK